MTINGVEHLREELKKLKSVDRPEIITAIATAREFGDLKENAEYHAAKEKQSFIEGRISEIESKLSNSEVIDINKLSISNKVVFGSTVTLLNLDNDRIITYKIVGEDEADLIKGKISVTSPISRSLFGKSEGDAVTIKTPSRNIIYEIVEVKYV